MDDGSGQTYWRQMPRSTNSSKQKEAKRIWNARQRIKHLWLRSHESRLIKAVKRRTLLWDAGHLEYTCYQLRIAAWKEVTAELAIETVDFDEAKNKWNSLRRKFKGLVRKCPLNGTNAQGFDEDAKIKWRHFNEMHFLAPASKIKKIDALSSDGASLDLDMMLENSTTESSTLDDLVHSFEIDTNADETPAIIIQRSTQETAQPKQTKHALPLARSLLPGPRNLKNSKRCIKHLWLRSQESRLIKAVKRRTFLWDVGHPEYRWYHLRIAAWKEVAAELAIETVDFEEAKQKWYFLRSSFRGVLSKYPFNGTNSKKFDEEANMKWRHFDEMNFLVPATIMIKTNALSFDSASLDLDMMQENTTTESSTLDELVHSFEIDTNADETPAIIIQPSTQRTAEPKNPTPGKRNYNANRKRNVKHSWLRSQEYQLIRAVKRKTLLWDVQNPEYKWYHLRIAAWKEVAAELAIETVDFDEAKNKWNGLRSQFNGVVSNYPLYVTNSQGSEEDAHKHRNFHEMNFLAPALKMKKMDALSSDGASMDLNMMQENTATESSTLDNLVHSFEIDTNADETPAIIIQPSTRTAQPKHPTPGKRNCNANRKRNVKHSWLRSQESQLIKAVKRRSLLWDGGHPKYKWRHLRIAAWKEVAAELTIETVDFDEAKNKWNSLRSHFNGVVNNGTNSKGFNDEDAKMKWRHFDEMHFLAPALKMKKMDALSSHGASLDLDMMLENAITESSTLDYLDNSFEIDTNADETPETIIQTSTQRTAQPKHPTPVPRLARLPSPGPQHWNAKRKQSLKHVWLRSQKSQLIKAVKRRTLLWDVGNPEYKWYHLRIAAWKEVAAELAIETVDFDEAKHKWNALRSQFNGVVSKYPLNGTNSQRFDVDAKRHRHIDEMNFLAPALKMKKIDALSSDGASLDLDMMQENTPTESSILDDLAHSFKIYTNVDETPAINIQPSTQRTARPIRPTPAPPLPRSLSPGPRNWNAKRSIKHSWLRSQESQLIKAVKRRALLWDVGHPEYKLYHLRISAWKEVAVELAIETVDFDEAKHKWNALRSYFNGVVSKYPLNGNNSQRFDENAYKHRHFDEMNFLVPARIMKERDPLSFDDDSLDLDMMQENTTSESSILDDLAHYFEIDTNTVETPAIIIQPTTQRTAPPISPTPAPQLARSPSPTGHVEGYSSVCGKHQRLVADQSGARQFEIRRQTGAGPVIRIWR